jgi:hypothetical protein
MNSLPQDLPLPRLVFAARHSGTLAAGQFSQGLCRLRVFAGKPAPTGIVLFLRNQPRSAGTDDSSNGLLLRR